MPQLNVFEGQFEYDDGDPEGYRAGMVNVGAALGAQETAIKLFEIPPSESLCPYHYEYVEEWRSCSRASPLDPEAPAS